MAKFTPVQHSGFGYAHNYQFQHGIEERQVSTKTEEKRVRQARGILFDDYMKCSRFCDEENYPPGIEGMIPQVPGTFSARKIDELAIYQPGRTIYTAEAS